MAQMKLIPADNMKDKLWGKRGTSEREAMETDIKGNNKDRDENRKKGNNGDREKRQ